MAVPIHPTPVIVTCIECGEDMWHEDPDWFSCEATNMLAAVCFNCQNKHMLDCPDCREAHEWTWTRRAFYVLTSHPDRNRAARMRNWIINRIENKATTKEGSR